MKTFPDIPSIGITGGIGSGKTTVCNIFKALGIPVYDADYWAKWLINNYPALKNSITTLLGPETYLADGTYNRAYVAQIVFAQKEKLAALNALVHPLVEQHGLLWRQEQVATGCPYTLKEAALMIESGSFRHLDALIVVTAPEDLRVQRVVQRDHLPEEQVRSRIASQMPEAEKLPYADFIIHNDGRQLLLPQVLDIHRQILAHTF